MDLRRVRRAALRAAYRMIKKLSRDDRFIDDSDYYHYDGPEF